MANTLFPKGKQKFLTAAVAWPAGAIVTLERKSAANMKGIEF